MKKQYTSYELMQIVNGIFSDDNNDFSLTITDSDSTETQVDSIEEYLNIEFYTYKKDLKEIINADDLDGLNHWVISLNESMNKSYGLVELTSNNPITALDINGGNVDGRITLLMQVNKVANLEYFLTTIRNKYIGTFENITSDGIDYTSHIVIGNLDYDSEPFECVLGQCVLVSFNISIAYMEQVLTYQDEDIAISFNSEFDADTFEKFTFSKATETLLFTGKSMIKQNKPYLSGNINANATYTWSFTFWLNANSAITTTLEDILCKITCDRYYDIEDESYDTFDNLPINIPVWVRRKKGNIYYYQKAILSQYQKNYVNNDFTIGSIVLNNYAV